MVLLRKLPGRFKNKLNRNLMVKKNPDIIVQVGESNELGTAKEN